MSAAERAFEAHCDVLGERGFPWTPDLERRGFLAGWKARGAADIEAARTSMRNGPPFDPTPIAAIARLDEDTKEKA